MDFQAPNPAPEKASALLNNEIRVSTSKGVVCISLSDGISTNLNLNTEDLRTVAEQLLSENEAGGYFNIASYSDTTTADSDDPASSDCSAIRPPIAVKAVQSKLGDVKPKRRGGWPKGRKRKPELLYLPPKAPATGYNLYLNETRTQFKDSGLAFHEITKIVGNQWSNLSLEDKQPYLARAEEDKRRYKDELRLYRQSGAYQTYLAKKRKKRAQDNFLSESDMDATDDIDDEDNEELYCRTCDQWFHNLHNKREHLQSRLHVHAIVGDMRSELESETEQSKADTSKSIPIQPQQKSISETMVDLISAVRKRELEVKSLSIIALEGNAVKMALTEQLKLLKEREAQLQNQLVVSQAVERDLESKIFDLWKVPSLFIRTDLVYSDLECSEYSLPE